MRSVDFTKEDWGTKVEPWHRRSMDFLISDLRARKTSSLNVLDIGCGKGEASAYIKRRLVQELGVDVKLFGIDAIERFQNAAESRGLIFKRCNINREHLPFEEDYFDIVFAFEVVEHLLIPENLAKMAYKALKPNGYLVVSTPNLRWWANIALLIFGYQPYVPDTGYYRNCGMLSSSVPVTGHIRAFTPRALKDLLSDFSLVRTIGVNHPYDADKWWKSLARWIDKALSYIPSLAYDLIIVSKKEVD